MTDMKKQTTPNTNKAAKPADPATWLTVPAENNDAAAPTPFLLTCLVDKQDLLEHLHVSERTLHTWRTRAALPFHKILGKIYYNRLDVQQFLLNHRVCNKPKEKKKQSG